MCQRQMVSGEKIEEKSSGKITDKYRHVRFSWSFFFHLRFWYGERIMQPLQKENTSAKKKRTVFVFKSETKTEWLQAIYHLTCAFCAWFHRLPLNLSFKRPMKWFLEIAGIWRGLRFRKMKLQISDRLIWNSIYEIWTTKFHHLSRKAKI